MFQLCLFHLLQKKKQTYHGSKTFSTDLKEITEEWPGPANGKLFLLGRVMSTLYMCRFREI